MMISQLPGDYVISLAELTGVKTENAYGYYVENVGNESETDPRGIINYKLVNNDEYMDLNLEIDLEGSSRTILLAVGRKTEQASCKSQQQTIGGKRKENFYLGNKRLLS